MLKRSTRIAILGAAALGFSVPGCAQPGIAQNGVINSASRIPTTLAGGPIARGALFTIQGVKFGSAANTTVAIVKGDISTPAKIVAITRTFVEARMPPSAPLGPSSLIVTVDGKASRPFDMEVAESNPGIFSRNGLGWGPGRIQNIEASGARVENSDVRPAAPGSRVAILTTGMGGLKFIDLLLGNQRVRADAAPPRPGLRAGETEIVARIPNDALAGCRIPVAALVTPERASNFVTIAIGPSNTPCDPGRLPQVRPGKLGVALLTRSSMRAIREGVHEFVRDHARISFLEVANEPPRTPLRFAPPPGTCAAYTGGYESLRRSVDFSIDTLTNINDLEGRALDAGPPLKLERAGGTRTLEIVQTGYYRDRPDGQHSPAQPGLLDPGSFVLSGTGGEQVGPFRADVAIAPEFQWTDREQIKVVDRSRGVTVHWKPGSQDQLMFVVASNVGQVTTALGMCVCALKPAAGQFTIPPALLANIPASEPVGGVPYDELTLASISVQPGFRATGLDAGFIVTSFTVGRYVEYR